MAATQDRTARTLRRANAVGRIRIARPKRRRPVAEAPSAGAANMEEQVGALVAKVSALEEQAATLEDQMSVYKETLAEMYCRSQKYRMKFTTDRNDPEAYPLNCLLFGSAPPFQD